MNDHHAEILFEGKTTRLLLSDTEDEVQRDAARGTFYEIEQLVAHRQLIPVEGMAVIDVGACIGNHALFYSTHTRAQRVFCFEPNPVARDLLRRNVEINSDAKIDLRYVEYGCSDERKTYEVVAAAGNLGGARLLEVDASRTCDRDLVTGVPLDSVLLGEPTSFIKIDVEGMELSVLRGASKILECYRPCLAIEVANENVTRFWKWLGDNSYCVVQAFRMYWSAVNYVCIPKVAPADTSVTQTKLRTFWEIEMARRKETESR